jgi:hypothetical protein
MALRVGRGVKGGAYPPEEGPSETCPEGLGLFGDVDQEAVSITRNAT